MSIPAPTVTVTKSGMSLLVAWDGYGFGDVQASENGGAWVTVGATNTDTYSVLHTSGNSELPLKQNAYYQYRVRLNDGSDTSPWSTATTAVRLIDPPLAPTSVTVARVSDTQQTVAWTRNASTYRPYTTQQVRRWDNVGDAWVTIATVLGTSTSFTDTTTLANRRYRYLVAAVNIITTTQSAWSDAMQTAPADPISLVAVKSGSNIVLTWDERHSTGMSLTYEISVSISGAAYTSLATGIATGLKTYTHVAPSTSNTHRYVLRAKSLAGATLYSGFATSNLVSLSVPPNAPTGLYNQPAFDGNASTALSWSHNTADSSPQTKRQLRYRKGGTGTWYEGVATSTGLSFVTLTPISYLATIGLTIANGDTLEWQVRTWGVHTDPSAWSATSTGLLSSPPTATIATPADGSTLTTSTLTATWGYYDAESTAQTAWEATLKTTTDELVEFRSGFSDETSVTFDSEIPNASSYRLFVRVRDTSGLWSDLDHVDFTTDYLPPQEASLTGVYDAGVVLLTLALDPVVTDVTIPAVSVNFERRIDGGEWVTFATGVDPASTVLDTACATVGLNEYRATTVSSLPSTQVGPVLEVTVNDTRWLYLSHGAGFGVILRGYGNLALESEDARVAEVYEFENREDPLVAFSANKTTVLGVSVELDDLSTPADDFRIAGRDAGVALVRSPSGRRVFGMLSPVAISESGPFVASASFSIRKLDYVG